ncbi:hypothetical protein [Halapricum salinum]|uniref:Uncharacterized protein n=1 Tax=Halapricum salinum TaxID=1457250 RepID=A0A4D6HBV2_9EURY|nr:hypothetical protein [Halapricum salinum]QCC51439.1 hypothetical protein DV733_09375 [Halapricum salinum]
MSDGNAESFQLRFVDGDVVASENADEESDRVPVEPGERTGFGLEVKDGALEVNREVRDVVERRGRLLEFGSREEAEAYARELSASGGALRVQAAPANEPRDVDAYLLADHNPSVQEPAAVDGETWTFDVGANLYGALGEAVLLAGPKPFALTYFVRQDLEIDEAELDWGLNVDVYRGGKGSAAEAPETGGWVPDCVVEAKDGWGGEVLERYYCEIKAGEASFQRSQADGMRALAADERVLKIRVLIEALPEQYSVRIHEVEPTE